MRRQTVNAAGLPNSGNAIPIRLTEEDARLLRRLEYHLGQNRTAVLRLGLRALAQLMPPPLTDEKGNPL